MPQVNGNADGLRSQGRAWGAKAQAAESQVRQLRSVTNAVGVGAFRGAAGDRMRTYVSQLEGAASSIAIAYDRIAVAAPRVADAIDDAKQAEDKRDKTEDALAKATTELAAAEAAVAAATTAVAVSSLRNAIAGHGPSAAQQQALDAARKRLTTAQHGCTAKQAAAKSAQAAFERADQDRERLSRAFADLCRTQSAAVGRALPAAPTPAPIGGQFAAQLGVLSLGKTALRAMIEMQGKGVLRYYSGEKATAADKAFAKKLEALGERADKVYSHLSNGLTVATNAYKALSNPKLDGHQKAEYITKHSGLQIAGGYAGGAAGAAGCDATVVLAPVSPLSAAGGAVVGGFLFEQAAKLPGVKTVVNTVAKAPGAVYDEVDKLLSGHQPKPIIHSGGMPGDPGVAATA